MGDKSGKNDKEKNKQQQEQKHQEEAGANRTRLIPSRHRHNRGAELWRSGP
jgi:hypothetical protein